MEGTATVQVAIADATFESEETIGNRAATLAETTIQRKTIELNKDFLMVAELRPEDPASTSLKDGNRAALDTSALGDDIRYRLLVYNQAGAFVTERDYIRGQEAATAALALDGGSTYTFVAVSLNQTTALPATTPAVATRTLANSQITASTGASLLMYYQHTMTLNGNATNRLDIILKHRKPQVTVTINSAQTGYNVTAIEARLSPHNDGILVNLSNGSYTQNGTTTPRIVTFSALGSQNIISNPTSFNWTSNNATSFILNSITIGPLTATNLTPFTNLNANAGVRYNILLNIVPNDQFLTYQGRPAARINGVIWARHNIGVATTLAADAVPMTANRHGDYFQWGRLTRSGTATSTEPNPYIIDPQPPNNAWNAGTEAAPLKGASDPCPAGYRVPTVPEFEALAQSTTLSTIGNRENSNTNFAYAAVMTSRRNSMVRLTLPAQGWFSVAANSTISQGLQLRGNNVIYFASYGLGAGTTSRTANTALSAAVDNLNINRRPEAINNKLLSTPLRCVGIQ
ncbi:hypothetical protein [Sphingobacterium chungjuense]|uniref:hypothetical protein n=1 Tax=Sphingobacterium chungjuense TaxID=2675553 RepID=UPI00140A347F|nr:hypothetical protein [Sphingobacterium chungjuense]